MSQLETEHVLVSLGWHMLAEADICWLDCAEEGFCYRVQDYRHIVLCLRHAMVLEAGAWRGNYHGAPLPPGSRATAWPWLPLLDQGQEAAIMGAATEEDPWKSSAPGAGSRASAPTAA